MNKAGMRIGFIVGSILVLSGSLTLISGGRWYGSAQAFAAIERHIATAASDAGNDAGAIVAA